MGRLEKIQFVTHGTIWHRRHFVWEEDVKVVLSRLPEDLWKNLKKVHFKDDARGNRLLGYTTTRGRREITLCALPHRVSLSRFCGLSQKSLTFGALWGSQWPVKAIRRFMLYDVLLHEVGHLQVVIPSSKNPRRKFADEPKADEFADQWREKLWSQTFDHPNPVHNPPSQEEIHLLTESWIEANLAYKKGVECNKYKKNNQAEKYFNQAIALYPYHTLALEALGKLIYIKTVKKQEGYSYKEASIYLRRAVSLDPALADGSLYLAMTFDQLKRQDDSRCYFQRAIQLDVHKHLSLTMYGLCLRTWGCFREAEKQFQRALRISPSNDWALREYALAIFYGTDGSEEKDNQKILKLVKKAVEIEPSEAKNHYCLAFILFYLEEKNSQQALHHVKEALRLRPNYPKAQKLLKSLTS